MTAGFPVPRQRRGKRLPNAGYGLSCGQSGSPRLHTGGYVHEVCQSGPTHRDGRLEPRRVAQGDEGSRDWLNALIHHGTRVAA
jgi:hypothetical protein